MIFRSRETSRIIAALLAAVLLAASMPQEALRTTAAGDEDSRLGQTAAVSASEEAAPGTGTIDGSASEEPSVTYTVTFRLMGHGEDLVRTDIKAGSLLEQTEDLRPVDEGFHFENWYMDDTFSQAWNFAKDTVESDLTLYAKWVSLEPGTIVVTLDLCGHGVNQYQYVAPVELLFIPIEPRDPGYRFLGWYKDADYTQEWSGWDRLTEDITLYAKWEETTYIVNFYFGHMVPTIVRTGLEAGSLLEETEDLRPTVPGYIFEGWYKDSFFEEPWDFEKDTVQDNMYLFAKLTRLCAVTFNLSGHGDDIVKTDIKEGSLLELTPDLYPTDAGYDFDGWYSDRFFENPWDFDNDTVDWDFTLYAKWTPTYTVTFDLAGHGDNIVKTDIRTGSLLERTEDLRPVDEGFHFENWYK
ncbi:MAG: InlB B-repeat-containing protein, partial [Acetatifactor sp.]|nr:InlB B-repeat-containing protein [Acetatifactor sp.]